MPANFVMLFALDDREAKAFKRIYLFALCFPVLGYIADLFAELCPISGLSV